MYLKALRLRACEMVRELGNCEYEPKVEEQGFVELTSHMGPASHPDDAIVFSFVAHIRAISIGLEDAAEAPEQRR